MKGCLSVFALLAFVGAMPAFAATNSGMGGASAANLDTTTPAVRTNPNVNYQKYETRTTTRTYNATPVQRSNVAYTTTSNNYAPANRSQMYYNTGAASSSSSTYNRSSTVRSQIKRKYYLAHPFFQPTEGKFGAITDISYNSASYNIGLSLNPGWELEDTKAKWSARGFAIKEDFSYGITDRFAVQLMGRFDSTKYKFDWSSAPDDEMKDNGLNIYGAGVQWRFVDNDKWIATASAYYERQDDVANEFVLDLKGGYKISKSTIYGLLRGWLVNFDDKYYGNGITGTDEEGREASLFLAYNGDTQTTFFIEGGLGVFSVLEEDWTLNLEAIYGHYDWHGQAYVKAAIGWQPNDWFALNIYGKTSFYDTADGQKLDAYMTYYDTDGNMQWGEFGKAKVDKYKEMSVGGQIIFYF